MDNDNEMRRRYAHLSSQKRGDLAILSDKNYVIYDQVKHQPKYQAIADIKMVSLVNSQGTWTAATRRNKDKIENPGLVQQEQTKNRKHAAFYSQIGYAFFAFAVSCFGCQGLCYAPARSSSPSTAVPCPSLCTSSQLPWPGRFFFSPCSHFLCLFPPFPPPSIICFPLTCLFPLISLPSLDALPFLSL